MKVAHVLRRAGAVALIAGTVAGIVVVERRPRTESEGASLALVSLAGFPQSAESNAISTSWFCPGVAAGDGIESARVVIANPSASEIDASIAFLSSDPAQASTVTVGPRSQLNVDLLRGRTVGVVVPIVEIVGNVGTVEQELVYGAGDVTSQCVSQTSPTWYFADGFTVDGSTHRLVITNPYPESAVVNVTFMTREGERKPGALQGLIIAPRSARNVSLAELGAEGEPQIAVTVTATRGQVIASRMQHYLGGGRLGYSTTVGTPQPLGEWWFTSGRTGPTVTEELIVFNPGEASVRANVAFFGEGLTNGITPEQAATTDPPNALVEIGPGEVVKVNTATVADLPKGDHAMVVSSLGSGKLVVEHVLSQITGGSAFTAITNGIPTALASAKWRVPTGLANGARNALSILNTTAEPGTFTISAIGPGGELPLPGLVDVALGPSSLASLDVPDGIAGGELVIVASVPVAVQRRTTRGHGLVGFGIVGALPVRSRR